MRFQGAIPWVVGALLISRSAGLGAQDTPPTQAVSDSSAGGYAPAASSTAAPAPVAPANTRAAIGAQLGFIDVLPSRTPERIRAEQNAARSELREAESELSYANDMKERTKAMVEVKKQEVSTLDARRKLAEKSKQEAEKVALEAEKKDAERHKAFLERRVSLHEAEIDRAKAAKRLAQASERSLELEMELTDRRRGRGNSGVNPAATRRQDTVILELEGKVLEAERSAAEAQKQVADKDVDIARRRLELHKAQVTVAGGN